MIKINVTCTNIDGEEVTKECIFNLNTTELAAIGGEEYGKKLESIGKAKDANAMISEVSNFLLYGYGERSEDGLSIVKSDEIRRKFESSLVYGQLFEDIISGKVNAQELILGMLPKSVAAKTKEEVAKAGV